MPGDAAASRSIGPTQSRAGCAGPTGLGGHPAPSPPAPRPGPPLLRPSRASDCGRKVEVASESVRHSVFVIRYSTFASSPSRPGAVDSSRPNGSRGPNVGRANRPAERFVGGRVRPPLALRRERHVSIAFIIQRDRRPSRPGPHAQEARPKAKGTEMSRVSPGISTSRFS